MPPRRQAGFTLVEAALLACILGIVLAVSVPVFVDTLQTSKVAEATVQLEALHRALASYYYSRHAVGKDLHVRCLPPPAGPAPQEPSPEPVAVDFEAAGTPGAATWRSLGFHPSSPLRYRYSYSAAAFGCPLPDPRAATPVLLRAEGDLDGDGSYSTFERSISINDAGELDSDPLLVVRDRVE